MTTKDKVTWDYDTVEAGQSAQPITKQVTPESISDYATVCRKIDAKYHPPLVQTGSLAMATQIFGIAPKNRVGIAENNEMSVISTHATPFAKAEGRWFAPIRSGDSITSSAKVLEKYERRGNKFVTVRLEPENQHGQKVAEIDHTSIFEFTKLNNKNRNPEGKRAEMLNPSPLTETRWNDPVNTVTFGDMTIGDEGPHFTIHSPKKDGHSKTTNLEPGRFPWGREHGIGGITIMGYIEQMLERWIPTGSLYNGGRLLLKAIKNFRAGDTMTYQATIVNKRTEGKKGLVYLDIKGVNHLSELTAVAEATLVIST